MSVLGGVYVCKRGYQPVHAGVDEHGEIIWELKTKEPWHLKMFPVPYGGDFGVQWMWKTQQEKGYDWDGEDA